MYYTVYTVCKIHTHTHTVIDLGRVTSVTAVVNQVKMPMMKMKVTQIAPIVES